MDFIEDAPKHGKFLVLIRTTEAAGKAIFNKSARPAKTARIWRKRGRIPKGDTSRPAGTLFAL
jgi:hypothetical protein